MKVNLPSDMMKAMQLTRRGRLADATRLIGRLLKGDVAERGAEPAAPRPPSIQGPVTIEGTAERIGETPTARPEAANVKTAAPADAATLMPTLSALTLPLRGFRVKQGAQPAPIAPVGAQFLARQFTGPAGRRDYKLYIPSRDRGEPLPLVVMLHGCTQSADDFATGTRMNDIAEQHGLLVAYPIQNKSANGSGCWNWFKPGDQQRNGGEPSIIAGITRDIVQSYRIDASRIYVAGLSAGGATAAIMGAAYPDVFAAVGVHSGLPIGAATDLPSALAAMRQGSSGLDIRCTGDGSVTPRPVPTIVFHGDRDTTVHPSNGTHIVEQIRAARTSDVRAVTHRAKASTGRAYSRTRYLDTEDSAVIEMWVLHGAGHAWSGGDAAGSFTDPHGPDASAEMVRFFLQHTRALP